jgi:hypothetical protein
MPIERSETLMNQIPLQVDGDAADCYTAEEMRQ